MGGGEGCLISLAAAKERRGDVFFTKKTVIDS